MVEALDWWHGNTGRLEEPMTTATAERTRAETVKAESSEAELRKRFDALIERAPKALLNEVVKLADDKAFAALAKPSVSKQKSIATRNQEARARMASGAFDRLESRCELWETKQACEILGITKQALSKKARAGHVLTYTKVSNGRTFYPSFQFTDNKPRAVIAELIKALKVDPSNREAMNHLVQHLVDNMDFSEPGEPSHIVKRFELLDDPDALQIIKRDYVNAFEMGQ